MNVMTPKVVVDILGSFGDGRWYMKENSFPMINYLNRKVYTPKMIDDTVKKYLQYKLMEMKYGGALPGEIKGHRYFRITQKGTEALDYYRNLFMRSLEKDPDKLAGKTSLSI